MTVRIKKLSVLQTGKVLALLCCFISAILFVAFLTKLIGKPNVDWSYLLLVIFYPVGGFVWGAVFAVLYNFIAQRFGGFELTMEITQEQ